MDVRGALRSARRNAGTLSSVGLGLVALVVATLFLLASAPRDPPTQLANVNLKVSSPSGSITTLNVVGDTVMRADGGATTAVQAYFVCQAATRLVFEISSQEAEALDHVTEPTEFSVGKPLADPVVRTGGSMLSVAGTCTENQSVDVRFRVDFPENVVGTALQRGSYAFGTELFALAEGDLMMRPSYVITFMPPKGAVLEDAFDAQDRTFNRAVWRSEEESGLAVYGRYTVPGEVARAGWLDNALLLLLGSLVGIGLEAAISRARRSGPRSTVARVDHGDEDEGAQAMRSVARQEDP